MGLSLKKLSFKSVSNAIGGAVKDVLHIPTRSTATNTGVAQPTKITAQTVPVDASPSNSFLEKKAGGTVVGNILRGTAFSLTGGLLGTGANMKQPDVNTTNASGNLFGTGISANDVGRFVGNAINNDSGVKSAVSKFTSKLTSTPIVQRVLSGLTDAGTKTVKQKLWEWFKTNWIFVLIPFGLVIYLVFFRKKSKTSNAKRRVYRK